MNPSRDVLASANRYPGQISWDYDRAEIIADGVVHAIGLCLGFIGAVTIAVIAVRIEHSAGVPILVYVIGLVTMLALSAAYNMWPVSPAKWLLRRFDHSAIYLLIAGTYTPFLAQMKSALVSTGVVPENSIRADSRDEGESEHHPTRCLPSSICFEHLSPTCSSRGAGLRSRTSFFAISSILL